MTSHALAGIDPEFIAESDRRIEAHRKGDFAVDLPAERMADAEARGVSVRLVRHRFQFGMCLTGNPESPHPRERRYFEFVRENFNTVVMENAAKWYATEKVPGTLTYEDADRLLKWADDHGLTMRGHTLFWSKPKFVQEWVQELDEEALRTAVERRLENVVTRYRGRLSAWDVNNEMLDGSFYQDRLGPEIRPWMFRRAQELDPDTPLFVNEYGILGSEEKTARYLALIRGLREAGAPVGGVGIQEHASERLVRGMRPDREDRPERREWYHIHPREAWASLDAVAELGLPIHLTEISARTPSQEERADAIETILRVGFAHPSVDLILLWGFWARRHWLGADAALVDADFNLLPAGRRYRQLVHETWTTRIEDLRPDEEGRLRFRGFFGTYEVTGTDADGEPWAHRAELGP